MEMLKVIKWSKENKLLFIDQKSSFADIKKEKRKKKKTYK